MMGREQICMRGSATSSKQPETLESEASFDVCEQPEKRGLRSDQPESHVDA